MSEQDDAGFPDELLDSVDDLIDAYGADDVAEIVAQAVEADMALVEQAIVFLNVAAQSERAPSVCTPSGALRPLTLDPTTSGVWLWSAAAWLPAPYAGAEGATQAYRSGRPPPPGAPCGISRRRPGGSGR
ncbi:hypothetical protein ACIO7M_31790 [Streptomyces toxytricini]|uniref:Uncharacterized protein n=1 Tax=Streptomyces toxytricini TaxID=67369 RepID=A0ABW8EQX5_STRT5